MGKLKLIIVAVMTLTLSACSSPTESTPQACSVADIDLFNKVQDHYWNNAGTDTRRMFSLIDEGKKQTKSKKIKDLYIGLEKELDKKGFLYDEEDSVENLIEQFETFLKNNRC